MIPKKQVASEEKEPAKKAKKPSLSIYLGYPLYEQVRAAKDGEPLLTLSRFGWHLFLYGWRAYCGGRPLQELMGEEPAKAEVEKAPAKAAQETREQLQTALDTILERAPDTVIEEVASILTERAGKYGEPQKE